MDSSYGGHLYDFKCIWSLILGILEVAMIES